MNNQNISFVNLMLAMKNITVYRIKLTTVCVAWWRHAARASRTHALTTEAQRGNSSDRSSGAAQFGL